MSNQPIVVVGAGLAGLACACTLSSAGRAVTVLEASDGVGGRVRTDEHEGFLLDRGFQVYLTAYPEGQRFLPLPDLRLHRFFPGALVRQGGSFRRFVDPWRHPVEAVKAWLGNPVAPRDGAAMLRLRSLGEVPAGETALQALQRLGFSQDLIEHFFQPWFGGVLLDRSLSASSGQLRFVFSMMARGDTVLPEGGMQTLPARLAERLPAGTVRLGARVASLEGTSALLATGERVEGSALVLATEGPEAHRLDPAVPDPGSRVATTLYYAAERSPVGEPILVLNGDEHGPVNHLAVLSDVAPCYAPPGQALISVSVLDGWGLDEATLASAVETQLQGWYGSQVRGWRLLRQDRIPHAQPLQTPEALAARSGAPVLEPGRSVCGDHRANASINGALESGRRAAEALLAG